MVRLSRKELFDSKWFKLVLVAFLGLGITAMAGLLPLLYNNIQSQGYHSCATGGYGFPVSWVNTADFSSCNCRGLGCGKYLTSYNWGVFGFDSSLFAGLGYIIFFMRRLQDNELFIGLAATLIGFFTTLSLIWINPSLLPFADLLWSSVENTAYQPWADTITTFVEWFMMADLAYIAIFLAKTVSKNLKHRQSNRPSLPTVG